MGVIMSHSRSGIVAQHVMRKITPASDTLSLVAIREPRCLDRGRETNHNLFGRSGTSTVCFPDRSPSGEFCGLRDRGVAVNY